MGKPAKRRTIFPYYKVLTRSDVSLAWVEARKEAFNSLEEARAFIARDLAPRPGRVLIVEGERSRRVLEV